MIEAINFAGQNWLITPLSGTGVNRKFLMILSGVVIVDFKGNSGTNWRRETFSIRPDLVNPLNHAINSTGIARPPGTQGANYFTAFSVEQWVPYSAPSSMFNKDQSVNSGFAVDVWRPNPFGAGTDIISNAPLTQLFSGIQVDTAVRDTDAFLHRLSYHISLVGKIKFGPIIIT